MGQAEEKLPTLWAAFKHAQVANLVALSGTIEGGKNRSALMRVAGRTRCQGFASAAWPGLGQGDQIFKLKVAQLPHVRLS